MEEEDDQEDYSPTFPIGERRNVTLLIHLFCKGSRVGNSPENKRFFSRTGFNLKLIQSEIKSGWSNFHQLFFSPESGSDSMEITGMTTLGSRNSTGEISAHISLGNKTFGHFFVYYLYSKVKESQWETFIRLLLF